MEAAQLGSRFDPDLPYEHLARLAVGLERVGLAPGAISREHLLATQTLPQRVLSDKPVELGDKLVMPAEREVSVDAILDRHQPPLVQARGVIDDCRLVGEVAERGSAPQRQCLVQPVGRPPRLAGGQGGAALLGERVETRGVDVVVADDEPVAARLRDEVAVAERLAQRRDMVVQTARRRRRRCLAPQAVDQALTGDGRVRVHEQHGEQQSLAALPDLGAVGAVVDLQLSEDAIAHRSVGATVPGEGQVCDRIWPSPRILRPSGLRSPCHVSE